MMALILRINVTEMWLESVEKDTRYKIPGYMHFKLENSKNLEIVNATVLQFFAMTLY